MQSHEERADQMLEMMGGSMDIPVQRTVLRRLILAEDDVREYMAEARKLNGIIRELLAEVDEYRRKIARLETWVEST